LIISGNSPDANERFTETPAARYNRVSLKARRDKNEQTRKEKQGFERSTEETAEAAACRAAEETERKEKVIRTEKYDG
jgi:hypothetical protein